MRWVLLLALAMPATAAAVAEDVVRLESPSPYDLQAAGFTLARRTRVSVEAVVLDAFWQSRHQRLHGRGEDAPAVHAWILDTVNRKPVWETRRRDLRRVEGTKALRSGRASLTLGEGRYEIYLFSGEGWEGRLEDPPPAGTPPRERRWWEVFFEPEVHVSRGDIESELPRCRVTLTFESPPASRHEVTGDLDGALISLHRVGTLELRERTFRIARAMTVHLHGVVERAGGPWGAADYAWIVNTATRDRVWDSSDLGLPHAGGSSKNRRIDHSVRLDPGTYTIFYGSDDSHAFDRFNATPPYDPFHYGVTMLPGRGFAPEAFELLETSDPGPPWIDLTRVGDGEAREQAFELRRSGSLHLQAWGEMSGGHFFDHAWIADAVAGDVVWEMKESNTRAGGGADKNRMFDGLVPLEPGRYVLQYATDGSHAWESWNAAQPFAPEAWGVTVRPAGGLRPEDVALVRDRWEGEQVIVRIDRVGNDARVRKRFEVKVRTRVEILAIGEGSGGRMFDYGWIENVATQDTVWRMTYDATRHAGGADKNRAARERIVIEPGTYEACYTSDGSHAFAEWNAAPPRDTTSWGILIRGIRE